jgi:Alcohol dehydrogenase GroES-like domain
MSRAVIYEKFGGPEVLELRDVPEPHAGPGEIRIRVAAVGLNPMDPAFAAMPELAAHFNITLPSGFGYDFAGSVDEVGEGANGFTVGDREGRPRLTSIAPTSRRFIPSQVRPVCDAAAISESGDAGHGPDVRRRSPACRATLVARAPCRWT